MKPRTKLQLRVVQLANELWSLSKTEKQWAHKECLEHRAYATKNSVLCLDCGQSFSPTLVVRKKAVCPHCSTKVDVKESRCRTDRQVNYFAVAEIVEEFQVIRNYEIIAEYKKGIPAKINIHEILQDWILPNGKVTKYGKNHNSSWCMDSWSGDMEIRMGGNYYYNRDRYDIYARKYIPRSKFKAEYRKYGIDKNLKMISFLDAIKYVPNNPKAETLLKLKQYLLLASCIGNHAGSVNQYWSTLKICFRNKYKINDISMYFDYLDLLRYFRKDVRNPKFICPKNLKIEHDRLMNRKRKILRNQELQREEELRIIRQQNLERAIIEYVERNKKFFNLEFTEGDISIKLLQSIDEFKEEGDELIHCVFTNEYYLKKGSLIFSAKVKGKRTETIEILIPEMKLEQSRGYDNLPSKHHDKIVNLMKKSIPKIRQVLKKTKSKKAKQPILKSA